MSKPPSRRRHLSINPLQVWSRNNVEAAWMATSLQNTLEGHSDPANLGSVTAMLWSMQAPSPLSAKQERPGRQTINMNEISFFHTTHSKAHSHSWAPQQRSSSSVWDTPSHTVTWGTKCCLGISGMMFPHECIYMYKGKSIRVSIPDLGIL